MITGIGAYSAQPNMAKYLSEIRCDMPFGRQLRKLTSFAPLDDVVRIDIINHPETQSCRGMLLYYENGAQRCVGEYRIGYHVTETYTETDYLSLLSEAREPGKLYVSRCTADQHSQHGDERRWACYRVTGWVKVQFDPSSISMDFADGDKQIAYPLQGPMPAISADDDI
jgi:hypothetical protein